MRKLSFLVFGLGLIALAAAIWYFTRTLTLFEKKQSETAEVILEQMRTVTKLVTAEGYFSEVYDYKDYYQWDITPLRKKALLRVKAKVIMGHDLENLDFTIDSATRKIRITDPGTPEIISVEHEVDYYDLTSGTFNRFSEADLNTLNERARNFITQVALKSNLVDLANTRKTEIYEALRKIAETAGYEFVIEREGPSLLLH